MSERDLVRRVEDVEAECQRLRSAVVDLRDLLVRASEQHLKLAEFVASQVSRYR